MKPIVVDRTLVARCGLYCGACRSFRKGRCPGCHANTGASWCGIRPCCAEHGHATCADCTEHPDPRACAHFHSLIARIFGLLFNSDRCACVLAIRERGIDGYAAFMAEAGRQTLPRR